MLEIGLMCRILATYVVVVLMSCDCLGNVKLLNTFIFFRSGTTVFHTTEGEGLH